MEFLHLPEFADTIRHIPGMPNIGSMELLVLLAFLAVLLGTVWLIARVVRRVLGGNQTGRLRDLETRVQDLERGP